MEPLTWHLEKQSSHLEVGTRVLCKLFFLELKFIKIDFNEKKYFYKEIEFEKLEVYVTRLPTNNAISFKEFIYIFIKKLITKVK